MLPPLHPTLIDRLKATSPVALCLTAALLLVASCQTEAQDAYQAPPPAPAMVQSLPPMDQLLAPIALYPDPLIALVLPASTYPGDLQAAAGFLSANNDPSQIDNQSWNESVKDLAHYPEVLQWMNSNMDWTQQLGGAFANSPSDVMGAIQDLRARARAAGTLTDSPQEAVVLDGNDIDLEPAQPDAIYVPYYDPNVVYFGPGNGYGEPGAYFSYSNPYPMGVWLGFDFDWHNHSLWAGNWYQYRQAHGGWRQPFSPAQHGIAGAARARAWSPPANAPRMTPATSGSRPTFARPQPMPGTPPSRRTAAPQSNTSANQRPAARPENNPSQERVERNAPPEQAPERARPPAPVTEGQREQPTTEPTRPPPAAREPAQAPERTAPPPSENEVKRQEPAREEQRTEPATRQEPAKEEQRTEPTTREAPAKEEQRPEPATREAPQKKKESPPSDSAPEKPNN